MSDLDNHIPTPEELVYHFQAMDDSVSLINHLIDDAPTEESEDEAEMRVETVQRNVEHLELMVARPYIVEDGRSLATYNAAITKGKGS